ncbi:MAG TPA: ParB N-terminal domain-containing protein [Gemmataceae bacterium]|jgi:ParB/RepB/Spo0J family partition protein|nr:ParB N-terminal domain-containing protein [Gemmataceae bacterium]
MRHTIASKPLDWFKFDNIRQCFEEDALIALGKSLRKRQWHPVVARSDGTVIDGERRVRAAKLEGLESLDTLIIDEAMSQSDLRLAQAATAMHRADLTSGEKYDLCYELLQLRTDWKDKDLAEHLCIHPSMVTRIMAASRTIPEVRQALKEGKLSTTDVYAISKVADYEQPALLEAKLHGASRDELEEKVKTTRSKNRGAAAVRVDSVRCPLPSGRSIVVSGPNLSLDDVVETFLEAIKEARKARDQSLDVKTWAAVMRDRAKSTNGESTRRAG